MTSPLNDIRALVANMPEIPVVESSDDAMSYVADWLQSATGRAGLKADKAAIALFAGAHGVARHGVSALSSAQASELAVAIGDGSAPVAKLCAGANIGLKMLDLALDLPGGDITVEPAMDERACAATIAFGMEAVAGGYDLLALSGFGAGLDTVSKALLAAIRGRPAMDWADEDARPDLALREKTAIESALGHHTGSELDGLDLLARLGGREIAAMAGAIIAARHERMPLILQGIPALAAAAALWTLRPDAVAHCRLASWPDSAAAIEEGAAMGFQPLSLERYSDQYGFDSGMAIGLTRCACWANS